MGILQEDISIASAFIRQLITLLSTVTESVVTVMHAQAELFHSYHIISSPAFLIPSFLVLKKMI